MEIEVTNVKGFQDILPPESLKREAVQKTIEKWFKLYGFLPIETPIIEFDELMRPDNPSQEDEAISDRFRLKDRAGRNLGLRYEFTFQLARIMKQNPNLKLPFKRYQIGPVFRDEPIASDRFRQFTQCDIDIIGDKTTNADAEILALVTDILKELNIKDVEIQVNNRKLLNAIIESVQITSPEKVMKELDKIEKLGEDDVKANLRKYFVPNQIISLFKLLEKDIKFFKENAFGGVDEIEELEETCKKYKIPIKFNPFMIRGMSYYTGNIFEIKQKGKSTIAGGGRYDKTLGKYLNKEIPAVGISFGLERITQLANIPVPALPKVIIIQFNEEQTAIKLAKTLRKNNISCILTEGKPTQALDYANSYKIPYAIFIGEDEAIKKKFKLKTLDTGKEEDLTEKQVIRLLK